MKKNKTLWIVVAAVVLVIAAAVVLALCLKGGDTPAPETSTVTTTVSHTTVPNATETATESAITTTKMAEIKTAPAHKAKIPALNDCHSMGVGGGEFYYAVGYKKGDTATQKLVATGIRKLENTDKLQNISDKWFARKVYPRDEHHDILVNVDKDEYATFQENGVNVGVIDGNAPAASFRDGRAIGFEIDVAKACFELFGIHPKFVAVTAENVADKLDSGEVDLVWGGLRDGSVKGIDYSEMNVWNLENEMCYYTLDNTRYSGETAFFEQEGKVALVKDTLCADFVKDRLKTAGYTDKTTDFATANDAFSALEAGDVYAVACDYLTAYAMWRRG